MITRILMSVDDEHCTAAKRLKVQDHISAMRSRGKQRQADAIRNILGSTDEGALAYAVLPARVRCPHCGQLSAPEDWQQG